MDYNIINNEGDDSHISLEESFYCSNPKIGVISKSTKNSRENNKYMNFVQEKNNQINNFTFSLNKEESTDYISKEKKAKHGNQCFKSTKKNKNEKIQRFISHPVIYENNFEDENFISHSIKSGETTLYKSSDDIKEKDRKSKNNILQISDNYRKSRKKIRKNTDNLYMNKISDFRDVKKIKKNPNLLKCFTKSDTNKEMGNYLFSSNKENNDIKIEKNKKKEFKLKSSITLRREISTEKEKNKNKFRISRINSINEKHLKNIYSLEKLNPSKIKIKKDNNININNNNYTKKYSSNLELQKCKSMDIKIKFDMASQNPINSTEKLILNYKNKKEIIEILSDTENINNFYEYMEICFQTLQDINIKEVPKSNYKLKISFPKEIQNRKLALFDLDETLVHCVGEITEKNFDNKEFANTNKVKVLLPNKKEILIGINIRPYWKECLDKIKNIYNIIIFTASHRAYSDAVLNYLDPDNKYFKYRLYRDSCVQYKSDNINFYVKDLDIFKDKFNLKDIIIIDNSILSFAYHLNNGIPVVPFYDSQIDIELPLLSYYLLSIADYNDLRIANQEHIKLEFFLKQIKSEEIESITTKKNLSIIEFKEEEKNDKNNNINDKIVIKDDKNVNNSEKKVFHISNFNRIYPEIKRLNSIKNQSYKNIDFFEKWKNAYLKLSSKK